jgi:putative oxidoreductase
MSLASDLPPWAPRALSLLRIVAGLLFLEHGLQKLVGFPPGGHGVAAAMTLPWFAGIIETVCGALLTAGLLTRIVAFVASGEMAVAYWMAHAPADPFPANNGGDAAILFCFVFLYFACAGAGPWSIDATRHRTVA